MSTSQNQHSANVSRSTNAGNCTKLFGSFINVGGLLWPHVWEIGSRGLTYLSSNSLLKISTYHWCVNWSRDGGH